MYDASTNNLALRTLCDDRAPHAHPHILFRLRIFPPVKRLLALARTNSRVTVS